MTESWLADIELVDACFRTMQREPGTVCRRRRLDGGGSGSGVFLLGLDDGRDVVLKVTTSDGWRERAQRELRFYDELARRLPVTTPRLLGMADSAQMTCLLLSTARPASVPSRWTSEHWIEIAAQLGALHHPKHASAAATELSWLSRPRTPRRSDAAAESEVAYWRTVGRGNAAGRLVERRDDLEDAARALPLCLTHGDLHADNLLVDEAGSWVFVDWQEVRLDHGPGDLALLWQRAEAIGARPPRSPMLDAYARARELRVDGTLRRSICATELLLLLFEWPAHLEGVDPDSADVLARRLDRLADEWHGAG